jgi:hypothetical protein
MGSGNDQRLTKAERKEQARIEREAIQRKQSARKRNRTVMLIGVVVLAAVAIGLVVLLGGDGGNTTASTPPSGVTIPDPADLPGIMQTPPAWPNNVAQLPERLALLSLPDLNDAPGALHHHIRLWIYVDGQPVVIPANIGLSPQAASPLHTHESGSGLVHVESADQNFQPVLAQFMDVWGVYFTQTCLGDTCNDGARRLRVFLNGQEYTGDPTLLPLTDLEAVVITMGTPDQLPDPMPDSFDFGT